MNKKIRPVHKDHVGRKLATKYYISNPLEKPEQIKTNNSAFHKDESLLSSGHPTSMNWCVVFV